MANSTFRREPVQYKSITDDTKLFHINGFKGLQVLDNPLVADTASCYMSKNVYRNEVGNLTVRPRIEYSDFITEDTELEYYWRVTINDVKYMFWYTQGTGTTTLARGKLVAYTTQIDSTLYIDVQPSNSCTMQIFNKTPYFLVMSQSEPGASEDTLHLFKYDIITKQFINVEDGLSIPLSSDNPQIKDYNILSDKIVKRKYNMLLDPPDQTILGGSNSMFLPPDSITFSGGNATTARFTLLNKTIAFYIPFDNDTIIIVLWVHDNITNKPQYHYIPTGIITSVGEGFTKSAPFGYIDLGDAVVFTFGGKDINYQVRISYITLTASIISAPYTPPSTSSIFLGFSNDVVVTTTGNNPAQSARRIQASKYGTVGTSGSITYPQLFVGFNGYWGNVDDGVTLVNQPNYNIVVLKTHTRGDLGQLEAIHILRYNGGAFIPLKIYTIVTPLVGDKEISPGFSETMFLYPNYSMCGGSRGILFRDSNGIITVYNNITETIMNAQYVKVNQFLSMSYVDNIVSVFQTSGNFVEIVQQHDDNTFKKLCLCKDPDMVFEMKRVPSPANANRLIYVSDEFSTFFILYINMLKFQEFTLGYTETIIPRPTDVVPYLSNLNSNILTSFFLDGYYWFITEDYVFGTGKGTIEFWDFAKYFELTNKAIGAIRISDTSFWVFHNNGAYLIYKDTSNSLDDLGQGIWRITQTANTNSCNFKNAVITLPISSNICTVTSRDISQVVLRKYVQTDERILQPITFKISALIKEFIDDTIECKIANYKYLTLFVFNMLDSSKTLVLDNQTGDWWLWDFPTTKIYQITTVDDNVEILIKTKDKYGAQIYRIYNLNENEFAFTLNNKVFEIYCDNMYDGRDLDNLSIIEFNWESAVQTFSALDYRKQLLRTTFTFTDFGNESEAGLQYYFKIYRRKFARTTEADTHTGIQVARNKIDRTYIASYNFLQLNLSNMKLEDNMPIGEKLNYLTKPKLASISFVYRILPGIGAV